MSYFPRLLAPELDHALAISKSVLLLGARQTGKTTLLEHQTSPALVLSMLDSRIYWQLTQNPDSLREEITALNSADGLPLIVVDEIQKLPSLLDTIQLLIDKKMAQFIITGSSARKLRHGHNINRLPGRVIQLQLDPLCIAEMPQIPPLAELLLFGSLPGVRILNNDNDRELLLSSYVQTYLEDEIRAEALVRKLGAFVHFLELAAIEAGNPINMSKLAQDIGISRSTIEQYYQLLEDCLLAERIMPVTQSKSRKRLTHAPKYLLFDLGVRRLCAKEGYKQSELALSKLFEQFVGLELIRYLRLKQPQASVHYWRDHSGPEVDYVVKWQQRFLPIEAKWTDNPQAKDYRHVQIFMEEYPCFSQGYLICRIARKRRLTPKIIALPWQELPEILAAFEDAN
jgi:predicted AAA+ superfamily ATPase